MLPASSASILFVLLFQFKKYKTRAPQQKAVDDAKSAGPARAPNCSSEQWLRPIARSVQLLQGEKRAVVSQVTSLQRKVEEDMHDIMAKVCSFH